MSVRVANFTNFGDLVDLIIEELKKDVEDRAFDGGKLIESLDTRIGKPGLHIDCPVDPIDKKCRL